MVLYFDYLNSVPCFKKKKTKLGLFIFFGLNFKGELKGFCKKTKFTYLFGTKWKLKITLAIYISKPTHSSPA